MNLIFTILILLSFNLISFSQNNFGIKLNGGISKISNNITALNATWKVQFAPSGQGGFFYYFHLGNNAVFGTELLFIQVEGKEKIEADFVNSSGNNTIHGTFNLYKHISYIGIPVYFGIKLNKLSINIGAQAFLALASSAREKGKTINNNEIINSDNKYDKLNIKRYDFGSRAGINYTLNERYSIDGAYYFGFNNIFNNQILSDWVWKVQQLTIGIKYNLHSSEKTE